jgi:hypothetical protein
MKSDHLGRRMVALFILLQGVVLGTLISLDYYHALFLILVALTLI